MSSSNEFEGNARLLIPWVLVTYAKTETFDDPERQTQNSAFVGILPDLTK
jgi:hypothetical protein